MNIDTDEDFPEHPKTVRFCALIGNPVGWAYIWKLWRFCAKFRPDGDLSGRSPNEIELAVGWSTMDGRFFDAAIKAGFIDQDERGIRVHNWSRRMGASMLRMDIERLRKAIHRAKTTGDAGEVKRLEDLMAGLKARLSYAGTRTVDGQGADVRRLSGGQSPNGGGTAADGGGTAVVSALLCSALQGSDLSPRDPGATEHVVPSTTQVEAPLRMTGYGLAQLFGRVRSEELGGTPWTVPPDTGGKASSFAERLTPEAQADVEPTMRLMCRHIAAGSEGWDDDRFRRTAAFAFGAWISRLDELRDELHATAPAAKTRTRKGEVRYDPI